MSVAFVALKTDSSVVSWGHPQYIADYNKVREQLADVQHIHSTQEAFAALKKDGSVVTWGSKYDGGDSSEVRQQLSDVQHIYSTKVFAALKVDGRMVSWRLAVEEAEALTRCK